MSILLKMATQAGWDGIQMTCQHLAYSVPCPTHLTVWKKLNLFFWAVGGAHKGVSTNLSAVKTPCTILVQWVKEALFFWAVGEAHKGVSTIMSTVKTPCTILVQWVKEALGDDCVSHIILSLKTSSGGINDPISSRKSSALSPLEWNQPRELWTAWQKMSYSP